MRPRIRQLGIVWLAALIGLYSVSVSARDVRILNLSWLTSGDSLLNNHEYISSCMLVPIAIKHFNERYSKIISALAHIKKCDVQLKLIGNEMYDTMGQANRAMDLVLSAYVSKPMDAIHGLAQSDIAQAIGTTAGALQIPVVSYMAYGDNLSNKQEYPTFFRTITTATQYADMLVRLFQSYNYTTAGIIYSNEVTGTGFKDSLMRIAAARNIRIVPRPYEITATGQDMQDQINQNIRIFIDARINVVFHVILTYDALFSMARAAYDMNFIDGRMHISHMVDSGAAFFLGADAETAFKLKQFFSGMVNIVRGYDLHTPEYTALAAEWPYFNSSDVNPFLPNRTTATGQSIYQIPPDYFYKERTAPNVPKYHAGPMAYDSIMAIGLAACGPKPTLKENLATLKFNGTTGIFGFDENYDRDATTILFALENVFLNPDPNASLDNVFNHVEVGKMVNGNWTLYKRPHVVYSGGRLEPPVDVSMPYQEIDRLPLGARIFGWVEASLGMLGGIAMIAYVVTHRKTTLAGAYQAMFMGSVAIGCTLLGLSIVPLTLEDDTGCMMFHWTFAFGFLITMTALSFNSVRVAMVWAPSSEKDVIGIPSEERVLHAKLVWILIFLTLSLALAILIAWQVAAPFTFAIETFKRDADGNPLLSSATCVIKPGPSVGLFVTLCVLYFVAIIITLSTSYWVRNAPERFQEARMTGVAGFCMFQVFFVGVPAAAAVWNNALPRFLVLSSVTFVLCMILLLTVFLPKVFNWRFSAFNFGTSTTLASVINLPEQQGTSYDPRHNPGLVPRPTANPTTDENAPIVEHRIDTTMATGFASGIIPVDFRGAEQEMPEELPPRRRSSLFKSLTKASARSKKSSAASSLNSVAEEGVYNPSRLPQTGADLMSAPTPAVFGSQIFTPATSFAAAASTGIVRQDSGSMQAPLPLFMPSTDGRMGILERMADGITPASADPLMMGPGPPAIATTGYFSSPGATTGVAGTNGAAAGMTEDFGTGDIALPGMIVLDGNKGTLMLQ